MAFWTKIAALTALALPMAAPSGAQDIASPIVAARLLPGWETQTGTRMAALELELAPGWKTYWRAPGEAGIPPQFDWAGSENFGAVTFHWPKPEVFDINGMRTLVYHDRLVLPFEVTPARAGEPVALQAGIDLGVCQEICVPAHVEIAGALAGAASPDPTIRAALARMPEPASGAGLKNARCSAEPLRDGLRLTADLDLPRLGPDEFAVVELADQAIWVSQADTTRDGAVLRAVADLVPPNAQPFALDRSGVTITVFGGSGRVVEVQGCTG